MTQTSILIVEDDMDLREALGDTLRLAGYHTELVQDGRLALDAIESTAPAMVITDIQMPRMDGHTLLKHIKQRWPDLPVMLMTAYGSIQKAVEAMREGAVDYLTKPFEAEVLVNMVGRYVSQTSDDTAREFIAVDEKSVKLAETARRVAATDATVMICGESGAGKEVLARYIHDNSSRCDNPFIAINCAAIPDNMLEATLFGYEKGAFTGAYKACPGKFEQAEGGTLLLDEISEMDLALQAKLLRVLQEREVERLGGSKLIALDVRVLATSNRNMREEVAAGRFREDLFYRLNVFPIHIDALRDRPADIIEIASALIAKHNTHMASAGSEIPTLSDSAQAKLLQHSWPGNVRELDNVIQRAFILRTGSQITAQDIQYEQDIPRQAASPARHTVSTQGHDFDADEEQGNLDQHLDRNLGEDIKSHETKRILEALRSEMGNRKAVAEKLGISQRTLRYKLARMRENGIDIPGRYGTANAS